MTNSSEQAFDAGELSKGSPYFPSTLWNSRLQLLWLSFTALHIVIGSELSDAKWISSVLTTLGALLILLLITHILHARDLTTTRPTLLLAFASLLVLGQEAVATYQDHLAMVFCLVVALVLGLLTWLQNQRLSRLMREMAFCMLTFIVLVSFTQLLVTEGIKWMIGLGWLSARVYVIAPHALGICVAITLSVMFFRNIFGKTASRSVLRRTLSFTGFTIMAVWASLTFNASRIHALELALVAEYLFVFLYVISNIGISSVGTYFFLNRRNQPGAFLGHAAQFILIFAAVNSLFNGTILFLLYVMTRNAAGSIVDIYLAEGLAQACLYTAICCAIVVVTKLSEWAATQQRLHEAFQKAREKR